MTLPTAPTVTLPAGALIVRIHKKIHGPIFFGPQAGTPPVYRFDAPNSEYGTIYAAETLVGAFVETVLRKPKGRILKKDFVDERSWSEIKLATPIILAKLYDEGLQAYGTDAGVISGDAYPPCRDIALDLFRRHSSLHGIAYRSKYNNGEICYAIFDRIGPNDFAPAPPNDFDQNPGVADAIMRGHHAHYDTSGPIPPLSKIA